MSKMLGGNNVPVAKTNVTAADFHSQNRLRTRQFCKHFGKQTGEFFLGKGLHEIWSITDETGEAVTELTDGTLYEVRITVADGGELDLSEVEKEIKFSCVLGK